MTLSSRIEAASGDQQWELLFEAAKRAWGWESCGDQDPDEWVRRWNRFHRKLEAEAYLDAAMMLVPEGWNPSCVASRQDDGTWWSELRKGYHTSYSAVAYPKKNCATEALALAAAAIRAKGTDDVR